MKSKYFVFLATLCSLETVSFGNIDPSRVHLVAFNDSSKNFLFRGNMPTNATSFAYDELIALMASRAETAGLGPSFPKTAEDGLRLLIISLNNNFDGTDFRNEKKFWSASSSASLGSFVNWPLGLAGILPPTIYSQSKRLEMANETVWGFDRLPSRLAQLKAFFDTPSNESHTTAIYVHCTAGCDRTGEVIGSFRLRYPGSNGQQLNTTKMYALDTQECGRSPNYFSTSALEWFCYYLVDNGVQGLGSCDEFAKCKVFGKCQPAAPTQLSASNEIF